ncbi:MAG: hypothetical protein EZS26_001954 [Candidatus Ordinivivax streblomastigis]|uniref:Smf/DprA SLOG domain-containing protein n=1 Tax=Candidatus Ordinivivax streblomastigis TaxID=2540710 RepID=A0A5M8P0M4_9BACT|nr:MAG: hypothetical protein EZS26_001954 [Candidatus Ordinivivax streblomastigis]
MNLQIEHLIAFQQLLKRDKALDVCRYIVNNQIDLISANDIVDCLYAWSDKSAAGHLFNNWNADEVKHSLKIAERIVSQSEEKAIKVISCFDTDFPEPLKHITQRGRAVSPLVLYYKGDMCAVAQTPGVAIIGTRNPTPEGIEKGEYYGQLYAGSGLNIISGLALGCDAAAHRGALKRGGLTTAFVAGGLHYTYPKENSGLAEQILEKGGAIISEYPAGTPVSFQNLIERNRLQAGLADAVIVIQTDIKKGGSMHAVRTAIENNKPVFAVEYDAAKLNYHPMIMGNLKLLEDNKALPLNVDTEMDVVDLM